MKLIDKDALIRNLCVNTKYGTYSECTDGSEVTFTSREIDRIIDEQPIISIISENNQLTLDEVKELKEGDVVWLKRDGGFVTIMIEEIVEYNLDDFMVFFRFTDKVGCSLPISMLYKDYSIYRNKPEEEQE